MERILIFSGTTEGRELSSYLEKHGVETYVSVATEYGKECAGYGEHLHVMMGRMDQNVMRIFMKEHQITMVIDATHPFASVVTANIKAACEMENISYIRCVRENSNYVEIEEDMIFTESIQEAVAYLAETEGKILIATGSKELDAYTALKDYQERCYARVLSTLESVQKSIALGFVGAHLIAMQGPFSREMNEATLRQVNASWFVTKESGQTGGYEEKILAARNAGAKLVVIKRPEETGKTLEEVKNYLLQNVIENGKDRE